MIQAENKIIGALMAGIMALSVTTIIEIRKVGTLEEMVVELAQYMNYDLENHKEIKSEAVLAREASFFRESDTYRAHHLDESISVDKLFQLQEQTGEDTYYILFERNECSHCIELMSDLYSGIVQMPKNIYFIDTDNIASDSSIRWMAAPKLDTPRYDTDADSFELEGTPTLLKVSKDKAESIIGIDAIREELGSTEEE